MTVLAPNMRLAGLVTIPILGSWYLLNGESNKRIRGALVVLHACSCGAAIAYIRSVLAGLIVGHLLSVAILTVFGVVIGDDTSLTRAARGKIAWVRLAALVVPLVAWLFATSITQMFATAPGCSPAYRWLFAVIVAYSVVLCVNSDAIVRAGTVVGNAVQAARREGQGAFSIEASALGFLVILIASPILVPKSFHLLICVVAD